LAANPLSMRVGGVSGKRPFAVPRKKVWGEVPMPLGRL